MKGSTEGIEADNLTVYGFDDATGFTTPTWQGRPVVKQARGGAVERKDNVHDE